MQPRIWCNCIKPALRPIEQEIIRQAIKQEAASLQAKLHQQLKAINYVQRSLNQREFYFYNIQYGMKQQTLGAPLVQAAELLWAAFALKAAEQVLSTGKLWLTNGTIGPLIFAHPKALDWYDTHLTIEFIDFYSLLGTPAKLDKSAWLPADLLTASETDYRTSHLSFLRPEEVYEVYLETGGFLLIGEVSGSKTGVQLKNTNDDKMIYFLKHDGDESDMLPLTELCKDAAAKLAEKI